MHGEEASFLWLTHLSASLSAGGLLKLWLAPPIPRRLLGEGSRAGGQMHKMAPNISTLPSRDRTSAPHWESGADLQLLWPPDYGGNHILRLVSPGIKKAWLLPTLPLGSPNLTMGKVQKRENGPRERTQRATCHIEIETAWSNMDGPAPSDCKCLRSLKRDSKGITQLSPPNPWNCELPLNGCCLSHKVWGSI